MATFIGAVSGAVTCGIGDFTKNIANFTLKATTQALSHGTFQGLLSGIQGGGFWTGMASGVLSSLASSAFRGGENTTLDAKGNRVNAGGGWSGAGSFAKSTEGMITFGTIMGGVGAELTGGNFWKGAVTGLVVSGLNHAMHQMDDGQLKPKPKKAAWDLNGDGKLQKVEADLWGVKGNRKSIVVDNSKIDWSGLKIPAGKGVGDYFSIDTIEAFALLPFETSSTYGGTSFKVTGANTVEVQSQDYHYKIRNNNSSIMDIGRHILTQVGYPSVMEIYNGPFKIYNIQYSNPTIKIK